MMPPRTKGEHLPHPFIARLATVTTLLALALLSACSNLPGTTSSGSVPPEMRIAEARATLLPFESNELRIMRVATPGSPAAHVGVADRMLAQSGVRSLHEIVVRGFRARLAGHALANGLRLVGPAEAAAPLLSITPLRSSAVCERTVCYAVIDTRTDIKSVDGALIWTFTSSVKEPPASVKNAEESFDIFARQLFAAMKKDSVLKR
jgi:hypothetical protein